MKKLKLSVAISVLAVTTVELVISIPGFNCCGLSSNYWCFNNVSAEICQMREFCKEVWKHKKEYFLATDDEWHGLKAEEFRDRALLVEQSTSQGEQANRTVLAKESAPRLILHRSRSRKLPQDVIDKINKLWQKLEEDRTDEDVEWKPSVDYEEPFKGAAEESVDRKSEGSIVGIDLVRSEVEIILRRPSFVSNWTSVTDKEDAFMDTYIFLTSTIGVLASRNTRTIDRPPRNAIHVYYDCPECRCGDYLIVYEKSIAKTFFHPINQVRDLVDTNLIPTTYKSTNLHREHSSMVFPTFHASIYRDGKIMASARSRSSHNWMERLRSSLEHFTIPDLFIPGTHQSGSYLRPEVDTPWSVKALAERWVICQNTTIFEQLSNGIRYLDVRVSCARKNDRCEYYYVDHGGIEMIPLQVLVDEVNDFLDQTQEIVILSFKEFTSGFDNEWDHQNLLKYLRHEFRSHVFLRPELGWMTPLSALWAVNQTLIISYNHEHSITFSLWLPIQQNWCDKRDVTELHDCLDRHHVRPWTRTEPSADMVQFTHTWKSVLGDALRLTGDNSIRNWADQLNPYILKWYYEEWSSTANIVAVDFFEITGIVELAIFVNEQRALQYR